MGHFPLGRFWAARIGFGAIQLPGPGAFGPTRDRDAALAVLRRAVELGVDHIDTAQFYGPNVANELIREALSPYSDDLVIVSKGGGARRDRLTVTPNVLLIPGTSSLRHLEENIAAADIEFDDDTRRQLGAVA